MTSLCTLTKWSPEADIPLHLLVRTMPKTQDLCRLSDEKCLLSPREELKQEMILAPKEPEPGTAE